MGQPTQPTPEEITPPAEQSGGVNVSGGRVRAGRDLAGRDIYEGFTSDAVQRLLLTVGGLVFAATMCSAVCFFASGFFVANQVQAFNREVVSTQGAARSMQEKLARLSLLRSGQSATISFSETELSSYVRFFVGPANGLEDARVRMSSTPRELALMGNYSALNGTPVLATFRMGTGEQPLELQSTAIKTVGREDSPVGWIVVPNALVAPAVSRVIDPLFNNVRFTDIRESRQTFEWTITVIRK